jgi:rubredoxin
MKCPSCGDNKRQEDVGQVQCHRQTAAQATTTLYRCGACDFLYTVPPLDENRGDDGADR